jgi:hypothetical protein
VKSQTLNFLASTTSNDTSFRMSMLAFRIATLAAKAKDRRRAQQLHPGTVGLEAVEDMDM